MVYRPVVSVFSLLGCLLLTTPSQASEEQGGAAEFVPQPTACIASKFTTQAGPGWSAVTLKLTNACATGVDLQSSTIMFNNKTALNTSFWGSFGSLSYPDNSLQITSQPRTAGGFVASMPLHFPTASWARTVLQPNESIILMYGTSVADYDPASVGVYLSTTQPPAQTGAIDVTLNTAQPADVAQAYAVVDVISNGLVIQSPHVPWRGVAQVGGLMPGTYTLRPVSVTGTSGTAYQGTSTPSSVAVTPDGHAAVLVDYAAVVTTGTIHVTVPPLPTALSGYPSTPVVTFTRADTGAATKQTMPWNATTIMSQLVNNVTYTLSTPTLTYNSQVCSGTFTPASLVSKAAAPLTTQLAYTCVPVAQNKITITVAGLPATQASLALAFTPFDGASAVTKTVALSQGGGVDNVSLTNGAVYTISAAAVAGYVATFSPQPLTSTPGATATITFKPTVPAPVPGPVTGGRVIAYLPGWKTPPPAAELAKAGYTHMMVAFGVFSTTQPGQIVSTFDTITPSYIASLHAVGIKAVLSLGGALTSIPNTTVDFHQVIAAASSPAAFQQTFVTSAETWMKQYGFDGIDIDIETGLGAGGSFAQPSGDIAVMAAILKQFAAQNPTAIISLVPQVANISATSGFDATWGNYASLVMQTAKILTWVGVQLYNTGCAYGIDQICYDPSRISSPDFSVAMATDLFASWPATLPDGRATGFQPYISYLTASQVAIGYPAPNATGDSDGRPATPVATIQRAIRCLRTAVKSATACDTYAPPVAMPGFGSVFNWEVTYDQNNGYKFATGLASCVQGACN